MRFALIVALLLLLATDVFLVAAMIVNLSSECEAGECWKILGWSFTAIAAGLLFISGWATWRIWKRLRDFR